ncbi:RecX family transcriptional regulator [Adlercreutzia sp. R21]|uniref:regulatory protein RecX n=1 Tax=Adlercreutzia wanghongyangiae TaxID=3111451 RepID=UPI002DB5C9CB|nr:RecX family transcriptional regulator [Adlercreutzia sp. R21]MEC4184099.1 RecX family transcriptional regulator [Adlercreutzia sp. R21]
MASKADILAGLRASVAAIERGEAVDDAFRKSARPRAASSAADDGGSVPRADRGSGKSADAPFPEVAAGGDDDGKDADSAFRKILRWVSVRERSSAYVRDRLARDDFPVSAIEEALERAVRVHAVDDRRYGDALIRMKLAAGKGLRDVEAELGALGIDPTTLEAWQEHDAHGRDAEVARAVALLQRRPPRAKRAREAAFRKLVGQGFSTDVAASASRQWSEGLSSPNDVF